MNDCLVQSLRKGHRKVAFYFDTITAMEFEA